MKSLTEACWYLKLAMYPLSHRRWKSSLSFPEETAPNRGWTLSGKSGGEMKKVPLLISFKIISNMSSGTMGGVPIVLKGGVCNQG